ncbi:MAG: T9SS type A sorting domain-containing protein [Bacteroidetes bacterium]|nr:T9SS type A sorting domain-containing protein [Bacteroidota bacterium]
MKKHFLFISILSLLLFTFQNVNAQCAPDLSAPMPTATIELPNKITITITPLGSGSMEESEWYLYSSSGSILAMGCCGAKIDSVFSTAGPYTFKATTDGDNDLDQFAYTIQCNGSVVLSGAINGGETKIYPGILTCSYFAPVYTLPDITGQCSATASVAPTATDSCAGLLTGNTIDPLSYGTVGTHVIHWTFDDGSGNILSQTQNVIVTDILAPVADSLSLPNVYGQCGASVTTAPTATDNCAGIITGITTDPLSFSTLGSQLITWIYDDGHGNTSTQSQHVIITDTNAPIADSVSLPDIFGQCTATVSIVPTATDSCVGTISGTTTDLLTYNTPGTHIITWKYNDGHGNIALQTQNVIIHDTIAPVADLITLPDLIGGCSLTISVIPTATDNCAGTISGTLTGPLTINTMDTTVITWTYNDGHGNITTQNQNVLLSDTIAPVADLASLPDITGECSVTVSTIPTATDNCVGTIVGTTTDPLTVSTLGTSVITWTFDDGNGNVITQNQNVTVIDTIAPAPNSYTLPGLITITITPLGTMDESEWYFYNSAGTPLALGCCGAQVANFYSMDGPYTFYASTVGDYDLDKFAYTIQCNGSIILSGSINGGETQTFPGITTCVASPVTSLPDVIGNCTVSSTITPTATDICAGIITGTTTDSLTYSGLGTYIVTWTFDDGHGNTSTIPQNFIVTDNIAPVADSLSLPVVYGQCSAIVTSVPTATDNCVGSIIGSTTDSLNYNTFGSHLITWTFDDGHGNISTQTQNVIVADTIAPIADSISLPDVFGLCSTSVTIVPTATDNCMGTIIGVSSDSLTYSDPGVHVITWKFDDGNGNISTQTQNVTINDTLAPVADLATLPDVTGECSVTVTGIPTATDNCAGIITGTTTDPLTVTTIGTSLITWTFNDGNGNISTQTQNVILIDTIAPLPNSYTVPSNLTITITALGSMAESEWYLYDATGSILAMGCCGSQVVNVSSIAGPYTFWASTDGDNDLDQFAFSLQCNGYTLLSGAIGGGDTQTFPGILSCSVSPVSALPDVMGHCTVSPVVIPTATDFCSGIILGTTTDPTTYTTLGVHVVNWTFDDGHGNSVTLPQNFVVGLIDSSVTVTGSLFTSNAIGATYQWIDCTADSILVGETNQAFNVPVNGSYAVIVSQVGCGIDTSSCITIMNVGIQDYSNDNAFMLYPNPVKDQLTIETTKPTTIEITNVLGEVLVERKIDKKEVLNISNFNTGVYFLKDRKTGKTIKFMKE